MTDITQIIERIRSDRPAFGSKTTSTNKSSDIEELDRLIIAALTDLQAHLRIAEKRAEDAEALRDFLLTEMDRLIEKARQS